MTSATSEWFDVRKDLLFPDGPTKVCMLDPLENVLEMDVIQLKFTDGSYYMEHAVTWDLLANDEHNLWDHIRRTWQHLKIPVGMGQEEHD